MKRVVHDAIGWWNRLLALFGPRRRARDIDDEIAFHLAMRQAEHERAGLAPESARRIAARQFGNVTALKEQTRDMWTFPSFDSLVRDIRYAFRTLRRAPGFALVAVLVLAIGIGATTAMFSLVDTMLLRGLPYAQADRLVVLIGNVERAGGVERRGNSYPDHVDWRARATSFEDMAAFTTLTATLQGPDEPEPIVGEAVSAPYFTLLGVSPTHGRGFTPEEDAVPNRNAVVILGDGLWRRRFGADPSILNQTIQLGTRTYTIVGIMPAGFTGVSDTAQFWEPFAQSGVAFNNRGSRGFQTLARLKDGATISGARAELETISRQLAVAYPQTNDKRSVEVSPLADVLLQQLRTIVVTLMAAVSLVLLIACANVAGLLIGRADARQREIAVRTALGAGPGRLLRQLITENCVLAMVGAVAGMAKCTQPCRDRGGSATRRLGSSSLLLGQLLAQRLELRLLLLRQVVLQPDHQAELGALDVALGAKNLVHLLQDLRLVRCCTLQQLLQFLDLALQLELLVEEFLLRIQHVPLDGLSLRFGQGDRLLVRHDEIGR